MVRKLLSGHKIICESRDIFRTSDRNDKRFAAWRRIKEKKKLYTVFSILLKLFCSTL